MKYIVMFSALAIGLFMGFFPRIDKAKPMLWKLVAVIILTLGIVLSFLPPVAGTFVDAVMMAEVKGSETVPVLFNYKAGEAKFIANEKVWEIPTAKKAKVPTRTPVLRIHSQELPASFKNNQEIVVWAKFNKEMRKFEYKGTIAESPFMTYPYRALLLERIRIMNFHVPMSWIAVIAFLISMIYSIRYLSKRRYDDDIKASSAAALGMLFTVLATVTGAVWAKFNWGMYWNWDPRQTSIFVLLLIYAAYFGLRSSIDKEELKARLSAVYSIIAFVTVPFLVFVVPRITSGLHPGAKGEGNSGPVLDPQGNMLASELMWSYGLALAGFTILFFWMMNLHIRYKIAKHQLNDY